MKDIISRIRSELATLEERIIALEIEHDDKYTKVYQRRSLIIEDDGDSYFAKLRPLREPQSMEVLEQLDGWVILDRPNLRVAKNAMNFKLEIEVDCYKEVLK